MHTHTHPINAGKGETVHGRALETLPLGKHKGNESMRMRVLNQTKEGRQGMSITEKLLYQRLRRAGS